MAARARSTLSAGSDAGLVSVNGTLITSPVRGLFVAVVTQSCIRNQCNVGNSKRMLLENFGT